MDQPPEQINTITPKSSDKKWIAFVLVGIIITVFGILPLVVIKIGQNLIVNELHNINTSSSQAMFTSTCYSFVSPTGYVRLETSDSSKCFAQIKSLSETGEIVTIHPVNSNVTNEQLQSLVQLQKLQLQSTYPDASVGQESAVVFAGLGGYKFNATYKPKDSPTKLSYEIYFLYNDRYNMNLNGSSPKIFEIDIASKNGNTTILGDLQRTWKWVGPVMTATPTTIDWNAKTETTDIVDTPCYSTKLTSKASQRYNSNKCDFALSFVGEVNQIGIHTFSPLDKSLVTAVDQWRTTHADVVIVEEKNLSIDGSPAHKIVFKPNANFKSNFIVLFLMSPQDYTDTIGYPISGFEISALYDNQSIIKENIDMMVANWKWK